MKLSLARIAGILGVDATSLDCGAVATGYSIDSRTVRPGELFFAVRGEKMDGHDFVPQALETGAVAAVVAEEKIPWVQVPVAPGVPPPGGEREFTHPTR